VTLCNFIPVLGLMATFAWAKPSPGLVDAARGPVPVPQLTQPPLLGNAVNDDVRRPRNYDMQPPTIPHRVDGYQIDKNFNKCLDCHARAKTEVSQAVPVSATHYIDRSGNVLPQISTRRYFCLQCHVAQDPVPPLVGNSFENVDQLSKKATQAPQGDKK
jgi:cytochrome c-type protein NapB